MAYFIVIGQEKWALYGVMWSFFTDLLDGWVARKYGWETPLGKILDPLGDKVLGFCILGALCWCQKISLLLYLVCLGRDLCIAWGAWWLRYKKQIAYLQPILMSKINTAVQGVFCVAVLWDRSIVLIQILTMFLWTTTLLSFALYGYKMWKKCP